MYTFGSPAPVHFALYYPFAYSDCQRLLRNIDHALGTAPSTAASGASDPSPAAATPSSFSSRSRLRARLRHTGDPSSDVYYHRELLTLSPEGRRVELLTISSCTGRLSERLPHLDGLFPDAGPRPHRFKGKPVVYVGARVHPGETASSYMVHGLLAFLLQPRNPYARALRNRFVFHVVPMINPDGVARGHFRTDVYGANLNRLYAAPSATKQPAIFAIKSILRQACTLFSPVVLDGSNRGGGSPVFAFIDLHGFTARHGCYIIGNSLPAHRESRSLMFAQLMQLYAPQFNANACSFGKSKRGMAPKRLLYGTPYGQLVPSALTPLAEASNESPHAPAGAAGEEGEATDAFGDRALGDAEDDDASASAGVEDEDDEEDGADAVATPRSLGDVEEDAAAEADALRRSGRQSPPIAAGHTITHESYAGELARVQDPYSAPTVLLPAGQRMGSTSSRLSDLEATRVSREWQAMKARITGKGEGVKEGTGRVCALKDFAIPHCYTVECSCNLLPHRRVYDRIFAAAHIHHADSSGHHASAHGAVDPKALEPPVATRDSNASSALPAGHPNLTGVASTEESSRIARVESRKVVSCPRCVAEPCSQLGTDRARALRSALAAGDSELASKLQLQPVAGYSSRHPYSCQVDSLQPPPGCMDYVPPYGFPTKPPKDGAYVCPWGTCHADPPSAFAAVGRGMAFALLDISGGTNGLFSRVTYSQWGSLDAMQRWSRRCTGAAYGVSESGSASRLSSRSAAALALVAGTEAAGAAVAAAKAAIAANKVAATPPVARRKRVAAHSARPAEPQRGSARLPVTIVPPALVEFKGSPEAAAASMLGELQSNRHAVTAAEREPSLLASAAVKSRPDEADQAFDRANDPALTTRAGPTAGCGSARGSTHPQPAPTTAGQAEPLHPQRAWEHATPGDSGQWGSLSGQMGVQPARGHEEDAAALAGDTTLARPDAAPAEGATASSEAARRLLRRIAAGMARSADGRTFGRARSFHGHGRPLSSPRPGLTDGLRMRGTPVGGSRDEGPTKAAGDTGQLGADPIADATPNTDRSCGENAADARRRHGNASPAAPRATHPPSPPAIVGRGGVAGTGSASGPAPRSIASGSATGSSQGARNGAADAVGAFATSSPTGLRGARFGGLSRLGRGELSQSVSMDDLRATAADSAPSASISILPAARRAAVAGRRAAAHGAAGSGPPEDSQPDRSMRSTAPGSSRSGVGPALASFDRTMAQQQPASPSQTRVVSAATGGARSGSSDTSIAPLGAARFLHRPLHSSGAQRMRMGSSAGRQPASSGSAPGEMGRAAIAGHRLPVVPLSQQFAPVAAAGGTGAVSGAGAGAIAAGAAGSSRGSSLRLAGLTSVGRQTPSPPPARSSEPRAESELPLQVGAGAQGRLHQQRAKDASETGEQAIDRFLRELAALEAAVDGSDATSRVGDAGVAAAAGSAFTFRHSRQGQSPTMVAPAEAGGSGSAGAMRRHALSPRHVQRPPARPAMLAEDAISGRGPLLLANDGLMSQLKQPKHPRRRGAAATAPRSEGRAHSRRTAGGIAGQTVSITGSRLSGSSRRK